MKRFIIILLVLVLLGGAVYFINSQNKKAPTVSDNKNNQAPDFIVRDVLGLKAPLSFFYEKKPVVLAFFSPGCSYCKQEIPALKRFHKEYKNDVYIIGIVSGQSNTDIKEYGIENKINFILSSDKDASILNKYDILSAPSHIVINKQGQVVERENGTISFNQLKYLTQKFLN